MPLASISVTDVIKTQISFLGPAVFPSKKHAGQSTASVHMRILWPYQILRIIFSFIAEIITTGGDFYEWQHY
jgi:hypothetical protein